MTGNLLLTITLLTVTGAACQYLAWRARLPAILLLLLIGIVVGPVAGWVSPDELLGPLLFPFVTLSVAIILFEGSLTLRFAEIRGMEHVVRRFVTSGLLVTWLVIALATRWLADFSWQMATLFGAIMVVTGPTVIVPMLRSVRPNARISNILRWEGIIVDPIGALLAVLVFEFIVRSEPGEAFGDTLRAFASVVGSGALSGLLTGYVLGEALRRDWLPSYLYNLSTLSAVFAVFTLSNALADESGLLAVTVMGIYLGNRKGVPIQTILEFKESLSLLLITVLFILLAARLSFDQLAELGWPVVGVFLAVQLVARPAKVAFCTWGSDFTFRERLLLAWIAPRGIVAAAVSALFAIKLTERGFDHADLLVPLTFVVIVGTVVLQSLTAGRLARLLHVAEPDPHGFLIIGANPVARAIASALVQQNVAVLLADPQWDSVSRARMAGLRTYFGNPLSEHAETYLDLTGLGRLLALSPDDHLNGLASDRFAEDFDARNVFVLPTGRGSDARSGLAMRGRLAFGGEVGYAELARRVYLGAEVRRTNLSDSFTYSHFRDMHGEHVIPLFTIDPKGKLDVLTEGSPSPEPGWAVLALVNPDSPSSATQASGISPQQAPR
jgi:NhaP-type Na+/H+ or K+/H+ antiporter